MRAATVVIGMGNPLMADEGVGIRLVEVLGRESRRYPDTEFLDVGTSVMRAVHAMTDRRKAILVDCAFMGEKPGTIRRFTPEDVSSRKSGPGLSLHEGDLLRAIDLLKRLGGCPPEVVLFGIEPVAVQQRLSLSPELDGRLEEYLNAVRTELTGAPG